MRALLAAAAAGLLLASTASADSSLARFRANLYATDSCLAQIIDREQGGSNWSVYATNRSSGAYGLPQALPGSKMASAGADWRSNPYTQLRWMRGYVKGYGGSCGAWAFWQRHRWYSVMTP